jgi:hypothetical protein
MTEEIPDAIRPIIEKTRKQWNALKRKALHRRMQKYVDHEVAAQNVGKKITVNIVNSLPFAVAQAVIMWNTIEVSWAQMQKFYRTGKPARADDPVYCWCLAWHEVAHFNVPTERCWSNEKQRYTRAKYHGPKFRKYCMERGHHPKVQADVELWRERFNEKMLG